jgi:hypothetical protein
VRLLVPLLAVAWALLAAAGASADPYAPPAGHVLTGVTNREGAARFDRQVRHRSAVFQSFVAYGYTGAEWAFSRAAATGARPMIHITTREADGHEVITPRAIARGRGDAYLLWLNARAARAGEPVYVRLFAEMDGYWNPYCAFDASGRARGPAHSTRAFRAAWRRVALILRGGDVGAIDTRLDRLRLPPVRTAAAALPAPRIALMWVPQVAGAPDVAANAPAAYWPGRAYVDWVGTDFYSKFPNFLGLDRFAANRRWRDLPFVFGEWAMWGRDDPRFVRRLFGWVHAHRQVRMLVYNEGGDPGSPFRLRRYPRSLAALRAELRRPALH